MELDELAFKWPRRIFQALLIGAVIVAIGWGFITGNSDKGIDLYKKEIGLITTPLLNWAERREERISGFLMGALLPEQFQKK